MNKCGTCRHWKEGEIVATLPKDVPCGFGTCRSGKIRSSYILEELECDGLYLTIDWGESSDHFVGKDFCCCHWKEIEDE